MRRTLLRKVPLWGSRGFASHRIHPALAKRAEDITQEKLKLEETLAKGYDNAIATKIARLEPTITTFDQYQSSLGELTELEQLFSDPAFAEDARAEHIELSDKLEELVAQLQAQLVPSNPFVDNPCLLEIRPGVGGSEAALFANDLMNMYQCYAQKNKWPCQVVSFNPTDNGGITEAILHITEPGAYAKLQYEGGVHRVQRVPDTETKGRIHTSTAAVVVLPDVSTSEPVDEERLFAPGELRIDVMRASGSGGQHVNTTESAVRLVHIPTGLIVTCQDERSQHKNKAKAMMVLRGRLAERERIEHEKSERAKRSAQVSSTERGDRIRTYNYPNNRITDHRCGFTSGNLSEVMAGSKFDEIVDKVDEWHKAELVKNLASE